MRALLLHTNKFESNTIEKSTRPTSIEPEVGAPKESKMESNLTVFFCVEKNDDKSKVDSLYLEIGKCAEDFATKRIMLAPFAHLSNNTAEPGTARELYEYLVERFKETNYEVSTSPFGYHKGLLLDIKGHPGSFRYREL